MSTNKIIITVILMLCTILAGCSKDDDIVLLTSETDVVNEETTVSSEKIYVHVCGEVVAEGVYELTEGSRVYEAIELAGGFTGKADTTAINMADLLQDGQQVVVQRKGRQDDVSDGKVNINTAEKEELMTLMGVGEAKASSIIAYREENGEFTAIEDIMNVPGIKEAAFEQIKNSIKVK